MEKQKVSQKILKNRSFFDLDVFVLCLCVTAVLFIAWTFTGQWPWKSQPYNSYILQAQSWLSGRLDLGQNYSHLEIAVFNGKYYISFPPFPSYVMLPFVLIGWTSCDGMIAFATALAGAVYAYKILRHFNIESKRAVFFALFLTVASNWLLTAQVAWVWFIAQNMAFTLCLMAIYYALKGKAGLSLSFWACAVGCRPFQALYIPVLLYIIYKKHMEENPDDKLTDILKKKWKCLIVPFAIALSYMILNYARFGNITEFGHNYLPEFMEAQNGQFSFKYLAGNLPRLFKLPPVNKGVFEYPQFNGMCLFFISPIFIAYVINIIRCGIKKQTFDKTLIIVSAVIIIIELLCIASHKTMGGSQFGNRYTNDVLPLVLLSMAVLIPKTEGKYHGLNYPLFLIGLSLNLVGTVGYYCNFFS